MCAAFVLAAALLVKVLSCTATDQPNISAASTPPAWPVSPYYNYWENGNLYYNPLVFAPKPQVSISYVNERDRPITAVEFGLYIGDQLIAKVRDAGHFSPGVTITHDLRLPGNVFPLPSGALRCEALSVTALSAGSRPVATRRRRGIAQHRRRR